MELSPRLRKIAEMIKGYHNMADIGSDHAYLPIYLIKNGQVKKAIAADINQGPVDIAKKRIKDYGTEAHIQVRKGSGLSVLTPGEAEAVVIAGMGGLLIRDILEADKAVAKSAKLLVLQPMRDSDAVRKWLLENAFEIVDEELVRDESKIYEILRAVPGEKVGKTDKYLIIGEKIIEKKHPLAAEYINEKVGELEKVLQIVQQGDTPGCKERAEECIELINYYKEVKKCLK